MTFEVNKSGAKYSAIVSIGEELRKRSLAENREFLYLNRGINQVVNIDLESVTNDLNYNDKAMQYYPAGKGKPGLRRAVNSHFFQNAAETDDIIISSGGMNALRLTLDSLKNTDVYTYNLFWGAYGNLIKISNKNHKFYKTYEELTEQPEKFEGSIVIICDPNNPSGEKIPDNFLLQAVDRLQKHNVTVIWDSPYRKLFTDSSDEMYKKLTNFENVIITESFSKSVGLSGQRVGFMYSNNRAFRKEFSIRLLFSGNGVNVFGQIVVEKLLTTDAGKKAVNDFRDKTTSAIQKNISFLRKYKLLAKDLYQYNDIWGIFSIVNKPEDVLSEHGIGSVGMNYFTKDQTIDTGQFSRICTSVAHEKFKLFFEKLI
ncbi:MAG: pyridoxal phosphate-dependent aminotransferase [Bacteroidota bacterium]|nr:pyridoxal phosphate-dependent aminotransferase [Bacteroidota bacterium]